VSCSFERAALDLRAAAEQQRSRAAEQQSSHKDENQDNRAWRGDGVISAKLAAATAAPPLCDAFCLPHWSVRVKGPIHCKGLHTL
jgi:hypothetical protein